MGRANEIKAALKLGREREFVIDPETGVITEEIPESEVTTATKPPVRIQAAHYTYD